MADPSKQVPQNVPGDFFVDSTCIDCDTCRQLAPNVFAATGTTSYVHRQPQLSADSQLSADYRAAMHALVSCPTGSIGNQGDGNAKAVMPDFPLLVEEPVYYCGFNSPKSYGGNSYFVRRETGNWLIDSPKFLPQLVRQFEAMGGVAKIFLTHRDDVADADQYAQQFKSDRIIHRLELSSQPTAELVLDGDAPIDLGSGFIALPTLGHTAGHCALLLDERFLFTGDHLYFDREAQHLSAFQDYCWDSWSRQTESMRTLTEYRFEWILPGHGQRVWLPESEMQDQLQALVSRM